MARLAKPLPETPTLGETTDAWTRSLVAEGKSSKTVTTYLYAMRKLAAHVGADRPLDKITRADHEGMIAGLRDAGLAPASLSTVYRSLRSFWGWVVAHDDMPVAKDPMNGLGAPKLPERKVVFLSDDELRAILATCKSRSRHNFLGNRDDAIIRLLASTGARLSEIANLRVEDIDLPGAVVTVTGKGKRERELPLDEPTYTALRKYLDRERPRHPSAGQEWVWLARAGRFTGNGIGQMLAERAKAAGLDRRVHPHELRHRFAAKTLGAGFSEGDVMALGGWRSRSMLDRYGQYTRAQRAQDAFRKASASGALKI